MNFFNDAVQDFLNNPSYSPRRKKSTQMSPGNTDKDDARNPSGAPDAENSLSHDVSEGPQTDPCMVLSFLHRQIAWRRPSQKMQ